MLLKAKPLGVVRQLVTNRSEGINFPAPDTALLTKISLQFLLLIVFIRVLFGLELVTLPGH